MRSEIDFGDTEVAFSQTTVSGVLGRQLSDQVGLTFAAGALVAGTAETEISEEEFRPGFAASASLSYLALFEDGGRPFILLSVAASGMTARAELFDGRRPRWTSFDMRGGIMVGKTIADYFVPYLAGRLFAGPVSWRIAGEEVNGSDVHKYTFGGGMTVRVPSVGFDLFVEAMPIGERTLSGGATLFF